MKKSLALVVLAVAALSSTAFAADRSLVCGVKVSMESEILTVKTSSRHASHQVKETLVSPNNGRPLGVYLSNPTIEVSFKNNDKGDAEFKGTLFVDGNDVGREVKIKFTGDAGKDEKIPMRSNGHDLMVKIELICDKAKAGRTDVSI